MDPIAPVKSSADWRGEAFAQDSSWVHQLSAADLAELDEALRAAESRGLSGTAISRHDFPLPRLGPSLEAMTEQLVDGRGFFLLRGLPMDRYSKAEASTIFWGIGTYIGAPWPQNAQGDLLGDVRDTGRTLADPTVRGYQTNALLPFHTDGADLVGLLCLRDARRGGLSSLVSSVACHNALVAERPDLLARLYEPFYYDWRGEAPDGSRPWYRMPVFAQVDGRLFAKYIRGFISSAQRFPDVPRLTRFDKDALNALDALAASPKLRLDMVLEPGDMQFINNYSLFHARTEFEDWDEPERKRHLKRLWLATDRIGRRPSYEGGGYDAAVWRARRAPEVSEGRSDLSPDHP